jgi:hypothetical protein
MPNNYRAYKFCGIKEMPFYISESGFPAFYDLMNDMSSHGTCCFTNLKVF